MENLQKNRKSEILSPFAINSCGTPKGLTKFVKSVLNTLRGVVSKMVPFMGGFLLCKSHSHLN